MLADLRSRGLSARSIHLHSHERAFVKLADQDGSNRQAQAGSAGGGDTAVLMTVVQGYLTTERVSIWPKEANHL